MNEKFNRNTKVEQLTNIFLRRGEEKGLIVNHLKERKVISQNPKQAEAKRDGVINPQN